MFSRRILFVILPVVTLLGNIVFADAITETDPRLSEKVTINCTTVRLRTAIERISAKTGVTIRTGKNNNDWHVRDIPVLVCARELPLGVLVKTIADTNHLIFTREKTDDKIYYRIWRDAKYEKELTACDESRKAALLAAASYDWDALSLVKDFPVPESTPSDNGMNDRYAVTKAVSRILNELSPAAKQEALNGDNIVLGLMNSPDSMKTYLMSAFEAFQKANENMAARGGYAAPASLSEQLDQCHVSIGTNLPYDPMKDGLLVQVWLRGCLISIDHYDYQYLVRKYAPEFPTRPEIPEPNIETDDLGPQFVKLSLSNDDTPVFLNTKIKIEALKDGKTPDYPALLYEISKATGYSIIAEGPAARYVCNVQTKWEELRAMFGKEITVRDALVFSTGLDKMDWYINDDNKLIVGRDNIWIERLKALVPEKLLLDMRDKLNSKDVELDDLESLAALSEEQCRQWIRYCPEFPEVETLADVASSIQAEPLWSVYFVFSPTERAQAQSGQPVSLARFDQAWLRKIMRQYLTRQTEAMFMDVRPYPEEPDLTPWITRGKIFTDSDRLPDLWLWIERCEMPKPYTWHYYVVHIGGQKQGDFHTGKVLYSQFPYRAQVHKAEQSATQ